MNEADPDVRGLELFPGDRGNCEPKPGCSWRGYNFRSNDREDEEIPGIPGWGDPPTVSPVNMLPCSIWKRFLHLGVNSDDGFKATIGSNFSDMGAQTIGSFNGGRGASDTIFEIYVEEAGLYPSSPLV